MDASEDSINTFKTELEHLEVQRRQCIAHLNNLKRSYDQTNRGLKKRGRKNTHLNRINDEINYTSKRILKIEAKIEKFEDQLNIARKTKEQYDYASSLNKQIELDRLSTLEWVLDMKNDYDVFISHSSEDKHDFVRPLAHALQEIDIRVWYDEFELKIGDSLRKNIDAGLANSRYGLVILSASFFNRKWTDYELNGFVSKELNDLKVVLPIWHKVSKDEVIKFSPSLADRIALKSSDYSVQEIAKKIKEILV